MKTPNFNEAEYIDPPTLNDATALVAGDLALAGGMFKPGLVFPEAATFPATGLTVQSNLPSPFAVLFGTGLTSQAHGTLTGVDTSTYSTSFSSLLPGTGTVTAYLVAEYTLIQQDPKTIIGPPVGHPDYNPNFQPYVAYTTNVDSLAIVATTTPPDNQTAFELLRCTLSVGASGLGAPTTGFQQRTSAQNTIQSITASGATSIPINAAGSVIQATASGSVFTLPSIASANDLVFTFQNPTSGVITVQNAGSDGAIIQGSPYVVSGIVSSVAMPQGAIGSFLAIRGSWQVAGLTQNPIQNITTFATPGNFNWRVPSTVTLVYVEAWGGGGGASGGSAGAGGAGGGGGYAAGFFSVIPGSLIPLTVGDGGSSSSGVSPANDGGTSTFSSVCQASGGQGASSGPGQGGSGVLGQLLLTGQGGTDLDSTNTIAPGGNSPRGGSSGSINQGGGLIPPTQPGGGGSTAASGAGGQSGASGMIVIYY